MWGIRFKLNPCNITSQRSSEEAWGGFLIGFMAADQESPAPQKQLEARLYATPGYNLPNPTRTLRRHPKP